MGWVGSGLGGGVLIPCLSSGLWDRLVRWKKLDYLREVIVTSRT